MSIIVDGTRMETTCPHCGRMNDGHKNLEGGPGPEDGDVTVCASCAGISVYDSTKPGGMHIPDPTQLRDFELDPQIQKVVAVVQILNS